MLHACHDSRSLALKDHIPLFPGLSGGGLYFNPSVDVVMVDAMYGEFRRPGTGLESIQRLAFLEPVNFQTRDQQYMTLCARLGWFKQLEYIFLLEGEHPHLEGEHPHPPV